MCYYITAILPGNANVERMRELARTHHLNLEPVHNEHVIRQLKPNEQQYLTTMGHCDCGTMIGAATRPQSGHDERNLQRKMKAFKDQGWSASKIDRRRRQHDQANDRKERVRKDRLRYWSDECNAGIEEWLSLFKDVATFKLTSYICVLLHHFNRGINSEPIQINGRQRLPLETATTSDFLNVEEDVLYEFHL